MLWVSNKACVKFEMKFYLQMKAVSVNFYFKKTKANKFTNILNFFGNLHVGNMISRLINPGSWEENFFNTYFRSAHWKVTGGYKLHTNTIAEVQQLLQCHFVMKLQYFQCFSLFLKLSSRQGQHKSPTLSAMKYT